MRCSVGLLGRANELPETQSLRLLNSDLLPRAAFIQRSRDLFRTLSTRLNASGRRLR